MSAALSFPPDDEDVVARSEALALFQVAQRMTEEQLRRLSRLEHGLVCLLDRIDAARAAIQHGQAVQIDALKLCARLSRARR